MKRVVGQIAAAGVGLAAGNLPSADLVARAAGGPDLRSTGTLNPGAMNASHVLGRKWGTIVTVLDVGKGTAAARTGRRLGGSSGANIAAVAAVIGHCFPVGRRGGKGVATSIGQVVGTFPAYLPIDIGVGVGTAALPFLRQRTRFATAVASATWIACATVCWRRGYANPGGVEPTAALPLGALASSLVIAARFATEADNVAAYNAAQVEAAGMIAIITDSASQIPPGLADRLGVDVVPVIVTIDGVDYREGVDLDADQFWDRFAEGAVPDVTTSQPSPGVIAGHYERAAAAGAEAVVSIHVGAEHSGTVNAARLAAESVDVPVHVVDSGTASFGVTCCVWEAAAAAAAGASADDAATRARATASRVGTTFIIQALDFARRGGRLAVLPEAHDGVAVLGGIGGAIDLLGTGHSVDELCDRMVAPFLADGSPIRAGVCLADPATAEFTDGIEARLRDSTVEVDLVRYRVGPSIAAHTGPGTAGGFWYPIEG